MAINDYAFGKLKIIAKHLSHKEFKEVEDFIYKLYMGCDVGYDEGDINGILADARKAYTVAKDESKEERQNLIKNNKKIFSLIKK